MKTFYLHPELHHFGSFSQILPTIKPIKQQTDTIIGSCLEQQSCQQHDSSTNNRIHSTFICYHT